jgi:8-oxo-dGTP diphosphatase
MPALNVKKLHPGLSVDCVIFGFHLKELKVLLLKLKNMETWALPGGFVEKEEDVDQAVVRVLKERTGLEDIFLQQFHFFGDVDRNDPGHAARLVEKGVISGELYDWFDQRFVTVGYYALVEYSKVKAPRADHISERCEWRAFDSLPELMLDHAKIVEKAYETLKRHMHHQPIGLNLLPKQFTMPELRALYETVLGWKLDRRNFQRKMLSYDILIRIGKRRTGKAHKAPWLYEFDLEKYQSALLEGLDRGWG